MYNKEYHRKHWNKYYKIHKEVLNKHALERHRIKYNTDINTREGTKLRTRLRKLIRGINKSEAMLKIVGCSLERLFKHLEKQFKPGMTWDNYGKWQIDHIKPCCKFDLSKKCEQLKCFNYKNLQPLWFKDNLKKGIF